MAKAKVQEISQELNQATRDLQKRIRSAQQRAKEKVDAIRGVEMRLAEEARRKREEERLAQELEELRREEAAAKAEAPVAAAPSAPAPQPAPQQAEAPRPEQPAARQETPAPAAAAQQKAPAAAAPEAPKQAPAPQPAAPAAQAPQQPQAAAPQAAPRQPQQGMPAQQSAAPRQGGAPGQFNNGPRQGFQPRQGGAPGQFSNGPRQGFQPRQGGAPGQFNNGPRQGFQPRQGGAPGQFNNGPRQGGFNNGPRQGGFNGPRPGGYNNGPRPGGFNNGPRPGGGFGGRPGGPGRPGGNRMDLTPAVEKERVSNYDPNKSAYARVYDSEKKGKNKKAIMRESAPGIFDDEGPKGSRKIKRRQAQPVHRPEPVVIERAVMTTETITVKDLSEKIGKPAAEIIKKLFLLGNMATINQEIDYDTASLVSSEFGITLEYQLARTFEDALNDEDKEDREEDLVSRPPVITIMGHVDHGKTSLLDAIRSTRVTESEAGGITQHIGAYQVMMNGQLITFLDTPGHEAFTAMRARGAQATDIAILVVAADDGIMPQTVEAINHAKAAKVPIIVAINKIDRPAANVERVKQELTEHGLVPEEWGGDTIIAPVSAVTHEGIDQLLEMILLVAEVQDLKANPDRLAKGTIIEAKLDKGRGPVATVLIQNGTLRVGDTIVAGMVYGRVRAMMNDQGLRVNEATPSMPVEVLGFSEVPEAGDVMSAVEDDKLSRQVAEERRDKQKAQMMKTISKVSLDDLFQQIAEGQVKELNIVVKADVQGSVEAVRSSLEKLSNDEVRVRVIHGAVGAISKADVMLASASNAIIVGFNVRPDNVAQTTAEQEKVDMRMYRVIYNAIEDIEKAMKGMLAPQFEEVVLGHAQVRTVFKVSGVGSVAGCYVTDGKIQRNASCRLVRDGVVVHEGKIDSLKRFKDDAREVASGYECGIGLENYNDVKEEDVIECYIEQEVER